MAHCEPTMSGVPVDVASLKMSDFELKPFMVSNNWRALYQIASVLVPYGALWYAAWSIHTTMPWLVVPIVAVMVLFMLRSFSIMHDCGHYSLFKKKTVNRGFGFLLGIVNGIPQYPWSRGHAYHHKHNGDWDRYTGPAVVFSVEKYQALSPFGKWMYAAVRHPLMLFPGGFFYLVVKPRVQLIGGVLAYLAHVLRCLVTGRWKQIATYESKWWYTTGEFWDILFNNICVVGAWILAGELMGHGFFWAVYAPLMTVSAAIFICVFYIQHNFEDSYAHRHEGWSYIAGAIDGSSYFKLPGILNWFTADIGYHNIHHLCSKVPNYRLAACHRANADLLADVHVLRIRDIPKCYGYILWDAERDRLTTIAELREQVDAAAKPSLAS